MALGEVYFKETFPKAEIPSRWVQSKAKEDYGAYKVTAGKFFADEVTSLGLQTSEDAKFYSISAPFDKVFDNTGKNLVIQFSAKFEQSIDCGGGYVKVMGPKFDATKFDGETDYTIMFGPDICGSSKRIHAIFNYKGTNHLIKKSVDPGSDEMTHLYTLIVKPDQTYQILLDDKEAAAGSLLEDWDFLPAKTIPDPHASKPADWVDSQYIADPEDVKPADLLDLPEYIADPDAAKPEDWDDDMDGDWEAPKIRNPDFKGEWAAKQIENPAYKGQWVHPEIANPEHVEDKTIYANKHAHIGYDLWQVKSGTIFDDIIVTDSIEEAADFAKETFHAKVDAEKAAKEKNDEVARKVAEAENEERNKKMEEEEAEKLATGKEEDSHDHEHDHAGHSHDDEL